MKLNRSNTVPVILSAAFGLIIGIGGTLFGFGLYNEYALSVLTGYEVSELQNKAVDAFRERSPDTGIYAQKDLISFAESRLKLGWLKKDSGAFRITGLAKARIAVNLSEMGLTKEAAFYRDQALSDLRRSDLSVKSAVDLDKLMASMQEEQKQDNDREKGTIKRSPISRLPASGRS